MQVGLFSSQLQGFLIPLQRLFRASLEIKVTGDTNYSTGTISVAEPVLFDRSQLKGTDSYFILNKISTNFAIFMILLIVGGKNKCKTGFCVKVLLI